MAADNDAANNGAPQASPPAAGTPPAAPQPADDSWSGWLASVTQSAMNMVGMGDAPAEQPAQAAKYDDMKAVERENDKGVHFSEVDDGTRRELWSKFTGLLGKNVMNFRFSLPIYLFEPTTVLMRMAEIFQFSELLDKAAAQTDPAMRVTYVAAFVVSSFAHCIRVRKPFNPVLGETFEFCASSGPELRFLSEQVSHHPPISVSHAQGAGWRAGECSDLVATYWGNSVEFHNTGKHFCFLEKYGELYTWNLPNSSLSNIFIGGTFIDHFGNFDVVCHKTKYKTSLNFEKSGWFGSGRYAVKGQTFDPQGNVTCNLDGKWNSHLHATLIGESVPIELWNCTGHMIENDSLQITNFTKEILTLDEKHRAELPPSDSRFRPDRIALQHGDLNKGADEKNRVEELQRERSNKGFEKSYVPKWFVKDESEFLGWKFTGEYWTKSRNLSESERQAITFW